MQCFDTWWRESEIFCGEGGMAAAEAAWDAATENCNECIRGLSLDAGLAEIELAHTKMRLASAEAALEERDAKTWDNARYRK